MGRYLDGVLLPPQSEALVLLSDEAFHERAEALIARMRAAPDEHAADAAYRELVPFEYERVRRDAVRRQREGEAPLDLLLATVGAQGDSPALAVLASPARRVVLLHTPESERSANSVVKALGLDAAEARLEPIGDGKDPLVLYRRVLDTWQAQGCPARVAVDLTGGFKTMSAAIAAAGFAIPGAKVFYIDAEQPVVQGRQRWIRERRIEMDNPFEVFGELRRATARELLRKRQYVAAAAAYEELARQVRDARPDELRARLARGYDALERMDFAGAAATLEALADDLDRLAPQMRDDAVVRARRRVRANAEGARRLAGAVPHGSELDPTRDFEVLRSDACLDLGAMLLALAERRLQDGAVDVAALLAYRVLELVPQRRLAARAGVDTSRIAWEALASRAGTTVAQLVEAYNILARKKEHQLRPDALPVALSRAGAFGLLRAAFPDDVGQKYPLDRFAGVGDSRNRSVLAHGLHKLDADTARKLHRTAEALFEDVLDAERVDAEARRALRERHALVELEA